MRGIHQSTVSVATFIALAAFASLGVFADVESDGLEASEVLDALEEITQISTSTETAILHGVASVETSGGGRTAVNTVANDVRVVLPVDAGKPITLTVPGRSALAVGLPGGSSSQSAQVLTPGVVAFDAARLRQSPW